MKHKTPGMEIGFFFSMYFVRGTIQDTNIPCVFYRYEFNGNWDIIHAPTYSNYLFVAHHWYHTRIVLFHKKESNQKKKKQNTPF